MPNLLIANLDKTNVNEGSAITLTLSRSSRALQGELIVLLDTLTPDNRIMLPKQIIVTADQYSLRTIIPITTDNSANPLSTYTLSLSIPEDQQNKYLLITPAEQNAGQPAAPHTDLQFIINQDGQTQLQAQFNPNPAAEGSDVTLSLASQILMPKQDITVILTAQTTDPRIILPTTLTLPANQALVTTVLTIAADDLLQPAATVTVALALSPGHPSYPKQLHHPIKHH